jgi:hypothetical protein
MAGGMRQRTRHVLIGLVAAVVLGATALAYLHPAVMVQLSEQIWACFG